MKKINKVFTTTLITFALMAAAPSAMASHSKNYGESAQYYCKATNNHFGAFKNQGQCVEAVVAFLKGQGFEIGLIKCSQFVEPTEPPITGGTFTSYISLRLAEASFLASGLSKRIGFIPNPLNE